MKASKVIARIAGLIFAIAVPAFAQNPVTAFTDADGVPRQDYLTIRTCYGGLTCTGTCHIENTQDHTRMTCDEWFSRYCPSSLKNPNCKEFDEKVSLAIERD
jgi:hypothetical protein